MKAPKMPSRTMTTNCYAGSVDGRVKLTLAHRYRQQQVEFEPKLAVSFVCTNSTPDDPIHSQLSTTTTASNTTSTSTPSLDHLLLQTTTNLGRISHQLQHQTHSHLNSHLNSQSHTSLLKASKMVPWWVHTRKWKRKDIPY